MLSVITTTHSVWLFQALEHTIMYSRSETIG